MQSNRSFSYCEFASTEPVRTASLRNSENQRSNALFQLLDVTDFYEYRMDVTGTGGLLSHSGGIAVRPPQAHLGSPDDNLLATVLVEQRSPLTALCGAS